MTLSVDQSIKRQADMLVKLGVVDSVSSLFADGVRSHLIRLSEKERNEILKEKKAELARLEKIFAELSELDNESRKLLDEFFSIYRNAAANVRSRFGGGAKYRDAQLGMIRGRWKEIGAAFPGMTPEEAYRRLEDMLKEVID